MRLELTENIINEMPRIIRKIGAGELRVLEICPVSEIDKSVQFVRVVDGIYALLDQELYADIWLKNFPICAINENARDHVIAEPGYSGEKKEECKLCRYNERCPGFPAGYFTRFGTGEVRPVPDLPVEVMIEVEPRCNFNCKFCFNRISFAEHGRKIPALGSEYIKRIVDNVADAGIRVVRFTGGEPLLRGDIRELSAYAKDGGLEVRLNSNCYLVDPTNIGQYRNLFDNVLIPIESWNSERERRITGCEASLERKVTAIRLFRGAGVTVVRVGTVASRENIRNFSKLAEFILNLPVDEWELYRPISGRSKRVSVNEEDISDLVDSIIGYRRNSGIGISLANAIPFCAIEDPKKLNHVSSGALYDDGHNRLVVDPRGFVKPHYFLDENIGDPLSIMSAWNHPFMRKMRNLAFLPQQCHNCNYKYKCRGGSRFEAKMYFNDYSSPDPLASANFAL